LYNEQTKEFIFSYQKHVHIQSWASAAGRGLLWIFIHRTVHK